MKKLKIILLFSLIFRIVFILTNEVYKTNYKEGTNYIEGIITDYKIKEDKIDITLKAKEKIKVIYYTKNKQNYNLGDKLGVTCELKYPNKNTNFYLFNYRNYLLSEKIYFICSPKKLKLISKNQNPLYEIKNMIIKRINKNNAKEYLSLFILGKNTLDDSINTSFRTNGISHLFAISGMHITLFSSLLLFILKKFKYKKIIIYSFLIFYMFLTNYLVSVLRSALLFMILNLDLKIKPNKALLLLALIFLTYNPYLIYSTSFLFSFTVSFTLLSINTIKNIKNYFLKVLTVSFIAFIITTPIMINSYFHINLLSPIINIIFVPIISFIIFPFSLITFIFPKLSHILIFMINIIETLSLKIDDIKILNITLCHIPILIFIMYYLIIIFILYKFSKRKYRYIIIYFIVILVHFIYPYLKNDYVIHFIDVGQGDSILVTLPHNKNILIDTGGKYKADLSKNVLIPYMMASGVNKIDYLILTHGDNDHMGESINLVNNFNVNKVVLNIGNFNDLELKLIEVLKEKHVRYYKGLDNLIVNNCKLSFLNTRIYDNENENSNVIYFKINNYKFLFMGDAGKVKEKDILKKYDLNMIDILKVGHHGSDTSSSYDFINKINPKYSVISVGKNNRYGHPKDEVLNTLSDSKIYRTDKDGSIKIKLNKNGYKIRTCTS